MGQALYRKYRSKNLGQIVGQEHVTETLRKAIKSGKVSHAYLFTGPRGVGKTSIARILAHEVNDLPYTDESVHLDIIEIDAASNRRIDEIRDLRDKVHIAPTSAKYKVYIIDEVHMLTKEAFNALLKTLEEPPAHVIFILATTEAHKLPETIVSRTQRFTFKAIGDEKAVTHLRAIADKEGIKIDDEALKLLAEHGKGSFRDSIGLLDQVGHTKKTITRADVEQLIGIAPGTAISELLAAAVNGSPADVVDSLSSLLDQGIAPAQISRQLAGELRSQILSNGASAALTTLLGELLAVSSSQDPLAALELALFRVSADNRPAEAVQAANANQMAKPAVNQEAIVPVAAEKSKTNTSKPTQQREVEPNINLTELSEWWPKLLLSMKKHNNTLYGILRLAKPELNGKTLTLGFGFDFHRKKIADTLTAAKIKQEIHILTGENYKLECIHLKDLETLPPEVPGVVNRPSVDTYQDELGTITAIFGGGEVLET